MPIIKEILFGKTEKTEIQLIRNVIVECVRYCVNIAILWILNDIILGSKYLALSTIIASITAGLVNYLLSSVWVFHKMDKETNKNIYKFVLFTLVGIIGLGINVGITTILTNKLGIYFLISNTIAQIVVFFFNFFARKKFVFSK